jgi:hypothetical protein
MPIANAPPPSQTVRARPVAAVTRDARSRAVYEATTAITTESATSRKSYWLGKWSIMKAATWYLLGINFAVKRPSRCNTQELGSQQDDHT